MAFPTGEVFSLAIPYRWRFSYIKAALVRSNVGVFQWFLKTESFSCLCWVTAEEEEGEEGPVLCCPGPKPSELSGGMAVTCRWEGSSSSQLLWSNACPHLYFMFTTSIWQLVTGTLSARCQGTGKPGRMKLFEVVTQTFIKHPGWAFIPPLDLCLELLNCLHFFQMRYFIMTPPGLDRRAIISFIV